MTPINKTDEIDGVVVEEDVDVILCGVMILVITILSGEFIQLRPKLWQPNLTFRKRIHYSVAYKQRFCEGSE